MAKPNKLIRINKLIFIIVILIELITVLFLFNLMRDKREKSLKILGINAIHREDIIFPSDSHFKYYFKLGPDNVQRQKLHWTKGEYAYNTISNQETHPKLIR